MAKEYIEREKAKEYLIGDYAYAAAKMLDDIPTADVVEVVRCKDCKHYEIHKPSVTLNCERDGRLIPMMPDDFCSYGERKEGAENKYAKD